MLRRADMPDIGKLRLDNMRSEPDLRSALLVLGSGDLCRAVLLHRQPDMRWSGLVRDSRRDLRRSGLLPWRDHMSRNGNLRHKHMSRRADLQRLILMPGLCDMPG